MKEGFKVWLFRPYFPSSPPRGSEEVVWSNIVYYLKCLQRVRKPVVSPGLYGSLEECKRRAEELEDFFGIRLENFVQYAERIGLTEHRL